VASLGFPLIRLDLFVVNVGMQQINELAWLPLPGQADCCRSGGHPPRSGLLTALFSRTARLLSAKPSTSRGLGGEAGLLQRSAIVPADGGGVTGGVTRALRPAGLAASGDSGRRGLGVAGVRDIRVQGGRGVHRELLQQRPEGLPVRVGVQTGQHLVLSRA